MKPLVDQLATITKKFTDTFGDLTETELNWKPADNKWSIAQNIQHIMLLNRSYFEKFDAIKQGNNKLPFISRLNFFVKRSGSIIKPYTDPARKTTGKTFDIWAPENTQFPKSIIADFDVHQQLFAKYLEELEVFFNRKTRIAYPGKLPLVFDLETACQLLVTHEERHFNQAKEVLDKSKN